MSAFDRAMEKREIHIKLQQELKSALKACSYMVNLYNRTGKAKQGKKLSYFLHDVVITH